MAKMTNYNIDHKKGQTLRKLRVLILPELPPPLTLSLGIGVMIDLINSTTS